MNITQPTATVFSPETTTTSQKIDITGAKKVTIYAKTTGNWSFSVETTPDGTNYYTYNKMLTNVANTNSQTVVRAATMQINTATDSFSLDLSADTLRAIKITGTRTGGVCTWCKIMIEK